MLGDVALAYDVVVVGAGVAGLASAYSLKKKGFSVLVLEKEDVPGGRMRTESEGGFSWDAGAQFLSRGYHQIFRLLEELGLANELVKIRPRVGTVYRGRVVYGRLDSPLSIFRIPGISPAGKLKSLQVLGFTGRDTAVFKLPARETPEFPDCEDMGCWARRELGRDVLDRLLGPAMSALFFWKPGEVSGAAFPLIRSALLQSRCPYALKSGMAVLPLALAGRVEVKLRSTVLNIVPGAGGSGVEIRLSRRVGKSAPVIEVVRAGRAVLAVPAPQVLSFFPGAKKILGSKTVQFLSDIQYSSNTTLGVALNFPVDGGAFGISYPPAEGWAVAAIAHEHYKVPARIPVGKGFSLIMPTGEFSHAHLNSPRSLIEEQLYRAVEAVYPGFTQRVEFTRLHRWEFAMPKFSVGYFRSLESFKASRMANSLFAFCGDYMAGPCMEAAAYSGLAAAEEVEKSLNQKIRP